MTLKKFLKYYDTMAELNIIEFDNKDKGTKLFSGYVFDKGAKKKLKALYDQGYELDRNEDGDAVILLTHINEHGVACVRTQINVRRNYD